MKTLFATSLLAIALAACVDAPPAPPEPSLTTAEPSPTTPGPVTASPKDDGEGASIDGSQVFYCVTAVPDHCVMISVIAYNAKQRCLDQCASLGYANPVCPRASIDDFPCSN